MIYSVNGRYVLNPDGGDHVITVERGERHRVLIYRAQCSCGGYTGRRWHAPGRAEAAAMDHVRAKAQ